MALSPSCGAPPVTTAATIWASAAIGMTIGFGYFEAGMVAAGGILAVLWLLPLAEYRIDRLNETVNYTVVYQGSLETRAHVTEVLRAGGLKVLRSIESRSGAEWRIAVVAAGRHGAHERLVTALLTDDRVIALHE